MIKLILLFLLLLTSCSSESIRVTPKQPGVDYVFSPYIDDYWHIINTKHNKYRHIYDQRIKKLSINFTNLGGSAIGRCHWLLNGEFEIEIDKGYWDRANFLSKKFLIYHELEHCIRFRMHTHEDLYIANFWKYIEYLGQLLGLLPRKGYFRDGCPNSIMHPNDAGEWCHFAHHDAYIDEMIEYKDYRLQ